MYLAALDEPTSKAKLATCESVNCRGVTIPVNRQTDGHTDIHRHIHTDRQTDRQTHTHNVIHRDIHALHTQRIVIMVWHTYKNGLNNFADQSKP